MIGPRYGSTDLALHYPSILAFNPMQIQDLLSGANRHSDISQFFTISLVELVARIKPDVPCLSSKFVHRSISVSLLRFHFGQY